MYIPQNAGYVCAIETFGADGVSSAPDGDCILYILDASGTIVQTGTFVGAGYQLAVQTDIDGLTIGNTYGVVADWEVSGLRYSKTFEPFRVAPAEQIPGLQPVDAEAFAGIAETPAFLAGMIGNGTFITNFTGSIFPGMAVSSIGSGVITGQAIAGVQVGMVPLASSSTSLGGLSANCGASTATTANSITLGSGASSTNGQYVGDRIVIPGGNAVGQVRTIIDYNGATKKATVAPNWNTIPTPGGSWAIYQADDIDTGTLLTGLPQAATANTVTLPSTASAVNNTYNNELLAIISGTGQGQTRKITTYDGATKIATLDSAWTTTPDTASGVAVLCFR